MQNMTGKVVFITGASTGIGRAAADRFAAAGAIVVGTSRWPWRYPAPPNWSANMSLRSASQTPSITIVFLWSPLPSDARHRSACMHICTLCPLSTNLDSRRGLPA